MQELVGEAATAREPEWQNQKAPIPKSQGEKYPIKWASLGHSTTTATSQELATRPPLVQPQAALTILGDCQLIQERITSRLKALMNVLPANTEFPKESDIPGLLNLGKNACLDRQTRDSTLRLLGRVANNHSGRIGLILPVTGRRSDQIVQILTGMRAFFKELGLDFDKHVILKDSGNTTHGAEVGYAELVLLHNVELVIGGLEQAESEILAQWGASLSFPTIVLTPNRDLANLSPYVFVLYPSEKRLAETLVQTALGKQKKRIAILKPKNARSDRLTRFFKDAVTQSGGAITAEIEYVSGSYESMQKAAKDLFRVNAPERANELREAYEKAKLKAAEERVAFNPKEVLLPPLIDFDALFIPDDFRSVRHFAKLFKFHMADKLTLIGNHEWRSFGLIDPPEPMLEGSFFADFVGGYASLPASLQIPPSPSPWFVDPDLVARVDFRLIGYRIGRVISSLVGQVQPKRSLIPATLAQLKLKDSQEGAATPVFDQTRVALWPTFVFRVAKNQLVAD